MSDTQTIQLHRVLRCTPDRAYRAFITQQAMAKWLPPFGFTGTVHEMDAQVGGRWRMSFTNFNSGNSHGFGGQYLELVPGQRLRYSAVFDAELGLPGEMVTTVDISPVFCGVELHITQAGIPAQIPAQACVLGWQESLTLLAQLVEPEIPG